MILPGATIGILGSGQLGRMLAFEARRWGYGVVVLSPDAGSPTGAVADRELVADYLDEDALATFLEQVQVVTYEFENVPAATAERCRARVPTHPSPEVLAVAQDRLREKRRVRLAGYPTTEFAEVLTAKDLESGMRRLGEGILKTARSGYDGKGQQRLRLGDDLDAAWRRLEGQPAVLEAIVDFEAELSVVVARAESGETRAFEVFENQHDRHILDVTVCPGRLPPEVRSQAQELALGLARDLKVVGVVCVEMFARSDGSLLVNELAPRPHNSGHLTVDACSSSQFEQQLRAVCDLPLGDSGLVTPAAAMANLLGDVWPSGGGPLPIHRVLPEADARVHLYGKATARPGRKMGHLTVLGDTPDQVDARVRSLRDRLQDS